MEGLISAVFYVLRFANDLLHYFKETLAVIFMASPLEILKATWPIFLIDVPRFTLTAWYSAYRHFFDTRSKVSKEKFRQKLLREQPLVTVVVPAFNEGENLFATISSLKAQTYPNVEIIIANDSSTDDTAKICELLKGENIRVVHAQIRQGKAFGHNIGLLLSKGKYIVVCDGDTVFHRDAIMEILLPFMDPEVKGVAGNVKVRNPGDSFITKMQALEYLLSIELGRRFSSHVDILWIISGAFGAFDANTVKKIGGWEVSPGEDKDITTSLRKMGFKVAFTPDAICYTEAPRTIGGLVRQRLRWSRSLLLLGVRKHGDLLIRSFFWQDKKLKNIMSAWDIIAYNILFGSGAILVLILITIFAPNLLLTVFLIMALIYPVVDLLNMIVVFALSKDKKAVLSLLPYVAIAWLYVGIFLKVIMIFAWLDEYFFRSSYHDPYVPLAVRERKPRWGEKDPYAELQALPEYEN